MKIKATFQIETTCLYTVEDYEFDADLGDTVAECARCAQEVVCQDDKWLATEGEDDAAAAVCVSNDGGPHVVEHIDEINTDELLNEHLESEPDAWSTLMMQVDWANADDMSDWSYIGASTESEVVQ